MTVPPGTIQHLASDRAGARPGDGTVRWLLPHERFFNSADMVACWTDANGRLRTFAMVDVLSFPAWLAAMLLTLPTTDPGIPGAPWLNNGAIVISLNRLDSYLYIKAINANSTTSTAGGFDALIAFVTATNSPGSNAARCLFATFAVTGIGTAAGGDFETQLLAWLAAATTASPPGVGLSSSSSPTLAATIAALRTSALGQSF